MKNHIIDALQIVAAILITSGLVVSAAPLPTTPTQASITSEVSAKEKPSTPVKEETKPEATPILVVTPTWQDNPNGCSDSQYIAQDAPFSCIDKPIAPAVVKTPTAVQAPVYTAPAAVIGGCGDNEYAQYIYKHESGCNLNAINSIGCRGIGQACPGGKLPCGADYACQNEYFTSYAIGRYGSWQAAYNFWLSHKWW